MSAKKYSVPVKSCSKPVKYREEDLEVLEGAIGKKLLSRLKREVVPCPVLEEEVPFLTCYSCPSFLRRIRGIVHCLGERGPRK